jgi:predicted ester cyclase
VTVDDVLASDDRAAVRWTFVGTHTAPLLDVAPRNRSVRVTGTTWFRIAGGRLVEAWDTWNQGRLLQSLGGVG